MCTADEFACLEHHFCVHSSWTCDGDRDCPDGSDEGREVCEEEGKCKSDEFKCVDGQCVPEDCYCDGEERCEDVRDAVCLGHQLAHKPVFPYHGCMEGYAQVFG